MNTPKTVVEAFNAGKRDRLHIAGNYPRELSDHWANCQPLNISRAYYAGLRAVETARHIADPAATTRADQYNIWTLESACEASVIRYTDGKRLDLRGSRAARLMCQLDELSGRNDYDYALHTLCVQLFEAAS